MDNHDMAIALNFVVEGWLHANGDSPENIRTAIANMRQCENDWLDVLEAKKVEEDE